MADIEDKRLNRAKTLERMRKKYPESDYGDDERIFGDINTEFEDYDRRLGESEERERAFSEMFTNNPRSARLMMEWKDGGDPVASLIRMYGKDELSSAIEDPERLKGIEEANKEWAERMAESDAYEAEYNKNLPESLSNLERWASNKGRTDSEIDKIMDTLAGISKDYLKGKFTSETLDMISNALNYETAREEARMEGEVAGRNAKIDEKLRKRKRGDGTPQLDGKSGGTESRGKRDLGALDRFDGSDANIWERGNEKRTSRR